MNYNNDHLRWVRCKWGWRKDRWPSRWRQWSDGVLRRCDPSGSWFGRLRPPARNPGLRAPEGWSPSKVLPDEPFPINWFTFKFHRWWSIRSTSFRSLIDSINLIIGDWIPSFRSLMTYSINVDQFDQRDRFDIDQFDHLDQFHKFYQFGQYAIHYTTNSVSSVQLYQFDQFDHWFDHCSFLICYVKCQVETFVYNSIQTKPIYKSESIDFFLNAKFIFS